MQRWLSNLMFAAVAVLAGTSAYYGAKSVSLERRLAHREQITPAETTARPVASVSPSASLADNVEPSTPSASLMDVPSELRAADRLSQPTQNYTVVAGDTLAPIGQKYTVGWERIADVNHLSEPYLLQIGQKLIIPQLTSSKQTQVAFASDPSQAKSAQNSVEQGKTVWRTDPLVIARLEHGGVFGLGTTSDYRVTSTDAKGQAEVAATVLEGSTTKTYQIVLIQPVSTGPSGIWAIQSITKKG